MTLNQVAKSTFVEKKCIISLINPITSLLLRNYKILTLTHKQAKLKDLSSFMLQHDTEEELKTRLFELRDAFGIQELLYLSTCNRVLFFLNHSANLDQDFLSNFCQSIQTDLSDEDLQSLVNNVQVLEGDKALMHLLEVSASIDSMVVGEREILRQLKEAYTRCQVWGLTGDHIRLAMKTTIEAAKEVYAKTRIGEKPISIVSLAIKQLLKAEVPKKARILLIGAGQTNTLVAKFLKKHSYKNVVVFNRSIDKAEKLVSLLGAEKAATLDQLAHYKDHFDVMITCTGHTQSWIDPALFQQLLQEETEQKVVIDLAVPNNLTEEVRSQFDLQYIEVEALRQLASENIAFRQREVTQAKELLEQQLLSFHQLFQMRSIERAMHQVPQEIKAIKSHAMNQVFKKELADLAPESRQLLERMMDYMERRCISVPMVAAKRLVE